MKYQNTDKVPLIYLSSNTNKKCYVIRVADDFSGYTLVQTIDYGGSKLSDYNWCDYVVDLNCNYLYVYQKFGASADKIFKCKVLKFLLPSISNQLTLQDTDERGEYLINGAYVNQAVQIYGDKMYAICGLNGVDSPYELDVADIGSGNVVTRLPLDWLGEPEGISFDAQGNMFISRNDIYKIEF